ncbi:MAG: hypothetical protein U0L56_02335 [Lachnospiraceae bacterium]|nr:hypothetical protein [Lachnospiraceae bacterium]
MQRRGKRGNKIALIAMFIVVIGICVLKWDTIANAVFNKEEAVHINPDEIENSTLIIGTHLIHLSAYNDEIRQKAETSESESGQYKRYYKSELAGGVWYDITDATKLSDISTGGKPVTNDEIRALMLMYHTKSDKITYDLRTNEPICIYNTPSPYDLYNMEELEPLRNKYDMVKSFGQSGNDNKNEEGEDDNASLSESDNFAVMIVSQFFNRDLTNEYTRDCDEKVNGLQSFYNILSLEEDKNKEMEIVMSMMKAVDAGRRAEIFRRLLQDADNMDYYMTVLYGIKVLPDTPKEDFTSNSDIISGLEESMGNVSSSYTENNTMMLQEGTTTKAKERYTQQTKLINSAQYGDYDSCREAVNRLMLLDNIENNVIDDRPAELEYLNSVLEPNAQSAYKNALSAGVSDEYKAIASNTGTTRAALQGLLNEQKNALNACRVELQEIISATALRMDSDDEVQKYLEEKATSMENYASLAADDDFAAYARSTVSDLKSFMGDAIAEAVSKNGGTQADLLNKQKEEYQDKLLECLDNNDLSGANKYEALVAEVDKAIAQEGGSNSGLIDDLKDEIIDLAKEGNTSSAQIAMEAMTQLAGDNPTAVNKAMNELIPVLNDLAQMTEGLDKMASFDTTANDISNITSAKAALDSAKDLLDNIDSIAANQQTQQNPDSQAAQKVINDLKEQIVEDVKANDFKNVASEMKSMEDMAQKNKEAVKDALGEMIGDIEDIISDNNSADEASTDGPITKLAEQASALKEDTDNKNQVTQGMLEKILGDYLEEDFMSLSQKEQIVVLNAVKKYADFSNASSAKKLMRNLTEKMYNSDNPYVYPKYNGDKGEFVATNAIERCLGYRYIYNNNNKTVVLSKKGDYYTFKEYDMEVSHGDAIETMQKAAGFQSVIYVVEDYTMKAFGCSAEYVSNSDYAYLITEEIDTASDEVFSVLVEMGERMNG